MSAAVATERVDQRKQAVTGLVPPQVGEALIRETWPSVIATPLALLARPTQVMTEIVYLRPLVWLTWPLLLLPFLLKIMPFVARRYMLTNRRLLVGRFGRTRPIHEIALADIQDVRIAPGSFNAYYRSATLEVLSKGAVALRLPGVPDPESFRLAILNACNAWAPLRPKGVMPPEAQAPVQGPR
jgi:hypothetical protein